MDVDQLVLMVRELNIAVKQNPGDKALEKKLERLQKQLRRAISKIDTDRRAKRGRFAGGRK